jgi:hypothetical protein
MDLQESALLSGQNYKSYYSKSKWQQAFMISPYFYFDIL